MPIPFDRKRYFKADKRQLMQTSILHIKLLRSQVVTLQEDLLRRAVWKKRSFLSARNAGDISYSEKTWQLPR